MLTLRDISLMTGLSKATISRVINSTGQVSEETKEKVNKVLKETHFSPNWIAKSLALKTSHSIGLVIPEFDGNYFGELIKQAMACAELNEKQLIVTYGKKSYITECDAIYTLERIKCDGIIFYNRFTFGKNLKNLIKTLTSPLIIINNSKHKDNSIYFDQENATYIATNHLIKLGHTEIACICPSLDFEAGNLSLHGYLRAINTHDLPQKNNTLIEYATCDCEGGYFACKKLLSSGSMFSCIICCNDYMAIGAYKALNEVQLKIPDDISIIGIGNQLNSQFLTPSLTTVDIPISEIITEAFHQLGCRLNENRDPYSKKFNGKLIIRESTRKHKNHYSHSHINDIDTTIYSKIPQS